MVPTATHQPTTRFDGNFTNPISHVNLISKYIIIRVCFFPLKKWFPPTTSATKATPDATFLVREKREKLGKERKLVKQRPPSQPLILPPNLLSISNATIQKSITFQGWEWHSTPFQFIYTHAAHQLTFLLEYPSPTTSRLAATAMLSVTPSFLRPSPYLQTLTSTWQHHQHGWKAPSLPWVYSAPPWTTLFPAFLSILLFLDETLDWSFFPSYPLLYMSFLIIFHPLQELMFLIFYSFLSDKDKDISGSTFISATEIESV